MWLGPKAEFGARGVIVWTFNRLLMVFGALLVLLSIPVAIATPVIPVGLPMFGVGVVILLRTSETAKRMFFRWARSYPLTSEHVRKFLRRKRK